MKPILAVAASLVAYSTVLCSGAASAQEQATMPVGALLCTTIEPAIEHARIVRQQSSPGLREFVDEHVYAGACRVIEAEVDVDVVDVDQRGFALVEDDEYQWWTDAENVWGYFDAADKLAAWKKR